MRRLTAILPSFCLLLVGAASFAISYNTLRLEAIRVQAISGGWPSYLMPIVLDGAVVSGSAVLWKASHEQRKRPVFPFLFVGALVILSVLVNISHAGPAPLAKLIASLPPLVLLGCLELVQMSHRNHTPVPAQPASAPASAPDLAAATASPASDVPRPVPELAVVEERAPEPVTAPVRGELTAAATAAAPQPPSARTVVDPSTQLSEAPPEQVTSPTRAEAAPETPLRTPAAAPARAAVPARAASVPAEKDAKSAAKRPAGSSDAPSKEKVTELFRAHLAAGGSATDPTLSRTFASELGVSQAHVRRIVGTLRRELAPAEA